MRLDSTSAAVESSDLHRFAAIAFAFTVFCRASDMPKFQLTVSLVRADIQVFDRHSKAPIAGLEASDFIVLDEGQPREIVYFGNESGPPDLVFLLDVSGSVREVLPNIADATASALGVLGEEDRAAVMAFSKTTVLTQGLTRRVDAVSKGIRTATQISIGLDTDINQALWSAANYLHAAGSSRRRAIVILTDNMQETHVPDSLVDEQLAECGAVLDGFLLHGAIPLPHVTHPGILGFARNSGGEIIEGNQPAAHLGEMVRRIKLRYSLHFRPVEVNSSRPRRIRVDLSAEARRRYPNAVVRSRRLYFPQGEYRVKPEIPAGQKIASVRTVGSQNRMIN